MGVKLKPTKKSGRRAVAAVLCQGLIALSPLSSRCDAQSRAAKTKEFAFEVVPIREYPQAYGGRGPTPDGFRAMMSIEYMIKLGYGQGMPSPNGDRQHVINLPDWANQTHYQVDARVAEQDPKAWQNQSQDKDLMRSAIRQILRERCHLVLHEQQVQRDGYQLVVRRQGLRLKPTPAGSVPPVGVQLPDGGVFTVSPNKKWQFYASTMTDLAFFLNRESDHPVYDGTKLAGRYDFTLQPGESRDPGELDLQYDLTSLGLELKRGKGPGRDFVIDQIEKPTPN